jgi:regulator of protease activity HflC (stomatin/prohibitin superfamily)
LKKYFNFVIAFFIIFTVLSMVGCTRVEPGYVGIKVVYGGGDRGVQDFPALTGWVFFTPFLSTVFEYPTYMQTAVWTKETIDGDSTNEEITFNTKEGLVVSGDISLGYQLNPAKVPHFYVKFRSDDLDHFTHGYLRNVARDAFNEIGSRYAVEDVYGVKKEELHFLSNHV